VSCGNNESKIQTNIENRISIDTISCGQNRNLVSVNYYLNGKEIQYLPTGKKFKGIFTFNGNFSGILKKVFLLWEPTMTVFLALQKFLKTNLSFLLIQTSNLKPLHIGLF